jgi:flagellar M-ring protein FliF
MSSIAEGLKALGPARLGAMAAVSIGILGLLAVFALRSGGQNDRMTLLYGDLELRDASQIADVLDKQHVPHELARQGGAILVPPDQVARARLLLAHEGLPSGGSIGYEIFDRGDGLTANQFQQTINQTRALEGELSRSIRMINGVRNVRVHLVLPKREPFSREQQEAQASVILTMNGAMRMDRESVQSVLNLVAAAVPGLRPQNISIVDGRGELLARAGQPSGPAGTAMTTQEVKQGIETRMARSVEDLLERSLGPGRVRADATIEMDFDQLRETQERYDPDGSVPRSTQSVTDNSKSTEGETTVSVQNNLPNAGASNPASTTGSQQNRQEETTNFEISKTVRTTVHDQPQIKKLSLAVMIDGTVEPGPDGKPVWKERSPAELEQIAALVKSAVGFDEKRGDQLQVTSMRFVSDEPPPVAAPAGVFGLPLERADLIRLAETMLFGVVALLTLLLVVRPMMMKLATAPTASVDASTALLEDMSVASGIPGLPGIGGLPALPAPGAASGATALLEDDRMVNLHNIEGQIRASAIRKVVEMVDKHPEETLTIMRGWMMQEAE